MNQPETVIKAEAKYHEANEPDRCKPILRIDDRNGRTILTHVGDSDELANMIRVSIDSGRDNPFKPGGDIYKMTDPIVCYYKNGPIQSRTQTPTYAQLNDSNSGNNNYIELDTKSKSKSRFWWRGKPSEDGEREKLGESRIEPNQRVPIRKRSCWRKWICCCCCCRCCRDKDESKMDLDSPNQGQQMGANIVDHYNNVNNSNSSKASNDIGTKREDLIDTTTTTTMTTSKATTNGKASSHFESNSSLLAPTPVSSTATSMRAKVVILEAQEHPNLDEKNIVDQQTADNTRSTINGAILDEDNSDFSSKGMPKTTTKTKSSSRGSKCVVS